MEKKKMVVFLSLKGPVCKIFVAFIANQLNTPCLTLLFYSVCHKQTNENTIIYITFQFCPPKSSALDL